MVVWNSPDKSEFVSCRIILMICSYCLIQLELLLLQESILFKAEELLDSNRSIPEACKSLSDPEIRLLQSCDLLHDLHWLH